MTFVPDRGARRTRAGAVRFAGADAARCVRARPIMVPERWCGGGRRGTSTRSWAPATWEAAVVGVAPGVPKRLGVGASACDAATIGATSVSAPFFSSVVVGTRTRALPPSLLRAVPQL